MTTIFGIGVVAIGVAIAVLALIRPTWALIALVVLDASNINGVIQAQTGIGPYKAELALAVVALFVLFRQRRFSLRWSPVLLGVAVLFAGFCLSLLHAADPVTSQAILIERSRDLLYFVVVFALICSTGAVTQVAGGVVIVFAALAGLTVVHEFVLHNQGDIFGLSRVPLVQEGGAFTPRHAGTSSDVNFWARSLIMFTPLALSLFAMARRRLRRGWWAGCALSLVLGVYLTQSRGGFIALFVAVVVWLAVAGGRYRRSLLALPIVLAVVVPLSGIGSRLATLAAVTSSSTSLADPSVVTRKRLQLDALRMFLDAPLTGHGIGSYGTLFPSYDRLSDFYQPVDIVVAAHNFYLEQAADGGIILLLAWLIFAGAVGFCCLRAIVLAGRAGHEPTRLLALGVLTGMLGWGVASIFLHLSDFRAVLLLAVLAAAVDLRARSLPIRHLDLVRPRRAQPPAARPVLVGIALTTLVASLAGVVFALTTGRASYVATATLGVTTTSDQASGSVAYQQDVISRGQIAPTFAAVLDRGLDLDDIAAAAKVAPDQAVSFQAVLSRLGGSVVLTTVGSDEPAATALNAAAVELSRARLAELQNDYVLSGSPGPAQQLVPARRWAAIPLAMLALGATVLLARLRAASGPAREVDSAESVGDPVAVR